MISGLSTHYNVFYIFLFTIILLRPTKEFLVGFIKVGIIKPILPPPAGLFAKKCALLLQSTNAGGGGGGDGVRPVVSVGPKSVGSVVDMPFAVENVVSFVVPLDSVCVGSVGVGSVVDISLAVESFFGPVFVGSVVYISLAVECFFGLVGSVCVCSVAVGSVVNMSLAVESVACRLTL